MIDADGFRANVGIILANTQGQVLWAKRVGHDSWQFPQGGIDAGETPVDAMYRELWEEVGLSPHHVELLAVTDDWLRYRLPKRFVRHGQFPLCIGQKQKWFLLRLDEPNTKHIRFDIDENSRPEFDHWEWVSYWYPLGQVVHFKRGVYRRALQQLARNLPLEPTLRADVLLKKQANQRQKTQPSTPNELAGLVTSPANDDTVVEQHARALHPAHEVRTQAIQNASQSAIETVKRVAGGDVVEDATYADTAHNDRTNDNAGTSADRAGVRSLGQIRALRSQTVVLNETVALNDLKTSPAKASGQSAKGSHQFANTRQLRLAPAHLAPLSKQQTTYQRFVVRKTSCVSLSMPEKQGLILPLR